MGSVKLITKEDLSLLSVTTYMILRLIMFTFLTDALEALSKFSDNLLYKQMHFYSKYQNTVEILPLN